MRILFIFLAMPLLAHAWGPWQATSFKKIKGMDWSWRMATDRPSEILELDCQSFIQSLRHLREGQEPIGLILDAEDCIAAAQTLKKCFPTPGRACMKGTQLPEVSCGRCR